MAENNINTDDVKGVVNAEGATIHQNIYTSETTHHRNYNHLTPLPPKNSNFIGRKTELEDIQSNLAADNVVCVVNGIGGVGKSELSYEYLHQHKHKYNKIAFIELTEEKSLEDTFYLKLQDSMQLTNDGFDTIVRRLQGYKDKKQFWEQLV